MKLIEDQVDYNGNGNYDVLPPTPASISTGTPQTLPKIDEIQGDDVVDANKNVNLPFIDDEQNLINLIEAETPKKPPTTTPKFQDRIITLTPKNLDPQYLSKEARNLNKIISVKEKEKKLYGNESSKFTHSFIILEIVGEKVCQHCHLHLALDVAIRCLICEFTCHQRCIQLERVSFH